MLPLAAGGPTLGRGGRTKGFSSGFVFVPTGHPSKAWPRSGHAQKPDQGRWTTGHSGPKKEQVASGSPPPLGTLTSDSSRSSTSLASSVLDTAGSPAVRPSEVPSN